MLAPGTHRDELGRLLAIAPLLCHAAILLLPSSLSSSSAKLPAALFRIKKYTVGILFFVGTIFEFPRPRASPHKRNPTREKRSRGQLKTQHFPNSELFHNGFPRTFRVLDIFETLFRHVISKVDFASSGKCFAAQGGGPGHIRVYRAFFFFFSCNKYKKNVFLFRGDTLWGRDLPPFSALMFWISFGQCPSRSGLRPPRPRRRCR